MFKFSVSGVARYVLIKWLSLIDCQSDWRPRRPVLKVKHHDGLVAPTQF